MLYFFTGRGEPLRFWEYVALSGYVIGFVAVATFAFSKGSWSVLAVLMVVGSASWLGGSLLGFLFGVPRIRTAEGASNTTSSGNFAPEVRHNTNMEQISDWLTKIIVGATLVQIGTIIEKLNELSIAIGKGIGSDESFLMEATVAGGVIIFHFAAGFIWAYLWCSLRISRELIELFGDGSDSDAKPAGEP
ncbi:MAG: hypothetical protein AAFR64_07675 [Pseudomonadota bacterium]